ncbi:hypothetical protein VB796_08205 [Arcicella sp. LKC2W]|uniref:hypothetical protein n=1 Tax=Arcicella sp. LKC2W TaxID=2984198 RepID=UPI002B20A9F0|nr:hypothetical protein [Arcicella sp. LKC2W]MEA5459015.1 hypothetical protein [Arcicella sp. LKC2W]
MKDTISHLHVMCKDWLRELEFYKTEIPFFKKRLDEVASKNTSKDIKIEVEHFENKFYIMNLHLDELLHDVKLKEESLIQNAIEQPKYINVKMIETDESLEDLMEFTATDFKDTKKEFYQFLSKYL